VVALPHCRGPERRPWSDLGLDHILLSLALKERLQKVGVDRETRAKEGASDHAPVWIKLRDPTKQQSAPSRNARTPVAPAPTHLSEAERPTRPEGKTARPGRVQATSSAKPKVPGAPLLAIDGDSFAHRSYHALPKTIRRSDGKGAGAILGFANFLLRFYDVERPRAVIVGWDTFEAPTRRHELF
jgi:hypothetical protein